MTLESSPKASPLLLSIGIGPADGFIQPHLSTFSQERYHWAQLPHLPSIEHASICLGSKFSLMAFLLLPFVVNALLGLQVPKQDSRPC
jgi:hypothetical protein